MLTQTLLYYSFRLLARISTYRRGPEVANRTLPREFTWRDLKLQALYILYLKGKVGPIANYCFENNTRENLLIILE